MKNNIDIRKDVQSFADAKYSIKQLASGIYGKLNMKPNATSADEANKQVVDLFNTKELAEQVFEGALDSYSANQHSKVWYFKQGTGSMLDECKKAEAMTKYTFTTRAAVLIDQYDWKAYDKPDSEKHTWGAYGESLKEHLKPTHVEGLAYCRGVKRSLNTEVQELHRKACGYNTDKELKLEDHVKAMTGNCNTLEKNGQKAIEAKLSESRQKQLAAFLAARPSWLKKS